MTKKFTLLIGIFFVLTNLQAQDESLLTKTWTLNFLPFGAGIIGEYPVSQKSTLKFSASSSAFFWGAEIDEEDNIEFEPNTTLNAQAQIAYRYYYKLKSKNSNNKEFLHNSGNFFSAQLTGYSQLYSGKEKYELDQNPYAIFHLGWGYQRMYKNKFVFSVEFGPGIRFPEKRFTLGSDLTLGIRLHPKKKK